MTANIASGHTIAGFVSAGVGTIAAAVNCSWHLKKGGDRKTSTIILSILALVAMGLFGAGWGFSNIYVVLVGFGIMGLATGIPTIWFVKDLAVGLKDGTVAESNRRRLATISEPS